MLFLTIKVLHLFSIMIWLAGILALPRDPRRRPSQPHAAPRRADFSQMVHAPVQPRPVRHLGLWYHIDAHGWIYLGALDAHQNCLGFCAGGLAWPPFCTFAQDGSRRNLRAAQHRLPFFMAMVVLVAVILILVELKPF